MKSELALAAAKMAVLRLIQQHLHLQLFHASLSLQPNPSHPISKTLPTSHHQFERLQLFKKNSVHSTISQEGT